MAWKTINSETIVSDKYCTVKRNQVQLPDGAEINDFYTVTIPDAALVVAIPWIANDLEITFTMSKGRITIFKRTLDAIQFPEYCHFLFNTSERTFAIQACSMDDEGAHRLIVNTKKKFRCEVNCTSLVRFVYQTCGWETENSYRILGLLRLDQQLIKFDLKSAQRTGGTRLQFRRTGTGRIVPVKFLVK